MTARMRDREVSSVPIWNLAMSAIERRESSITHGETTRPPMSIPALRTETVKLNGLPKNAATRSDSLKVDLSRYGGDAWARKEGMRIGPTAGLDQTTNNVIGMLTFNESGVIGQEDAGECGRDGRVQKEHKRVTKPEWTCQLPLH